MVPGSLLKEYTIVSQESTATTHMKGSNATHSPTDAVMVNQATIPAVQPRTHAESLTEIVTMTRIVQEIWSAGLTIARNSC